MIHLLQELEQTDLPTLLSDRSGWKGVDIDYHPPRVERLWRPWKGDYRVYLHRIYPCNPQDALFHPHPWPSAMHIVAGKYEMVLGFGGGDILPPPWGTIIAVGGKEMYYDMTHPDSWHYVRPLDEVTWTIMLTGKPWGRTAPKSGKPLKELGEQQRHELFSFFVAALSQ